MNYTEAQTEFSIRLYRWAKNALEVEISAGFPRFQIVKDWAKLRCSFFRTLDGHSKAVFGQGLLQMRHQGAVKALGEVVSTEAQSLLRREEAFRAENNDWVRASAAQADLGNLTFATRREIKKQMVAAFVDAFGHDCLPSDKNNQKSGLHFRMRCRGWIIATEFEFGRWDPEIICVHDVWTGKLITNEDSEVLFANCLGFQLNYGNEIGIGSGWDGITVNNVEKTCRSVTEHCQQMLDALPVLLENLDLNLLSE